MANQEQARERPDDSVEPATAAEPDQTARSGELPDTGEDAQSDDSLVDRGKDVVEKGKTLKERFDLTHIGRTLKRYTDRNGNVIAGGIAFFSMTAIAAGLLIAVTLASWFIAGDDELSDQIFAFLNEAVPGVVETGDGEGLVDPGTLSPTAVTGVAGLVGFLVLFNTAVRYVTGMRKGVWELLDIDDRSPMQGKMRDFAALVGIALMVLLGAGLQFGTAVVAEQVSQWLFDATPYEWVVRLSGIAVMLVVDMAFAAIVLVYLGGARVPRKYTLATLAVTALAMGVLRQAISLLISGVTENPVLAPFAAIVTLLLFSYFTARILLYAAAYLGTYRLYGPLKQDELSEWFVAWARDKAGAEIDESTPGVLRIDPGGTRIALEVQRDIEGTVTVSHAALVGKPWEVMQTRSLRAAQRHAIFTLALAARERAGIEERLVVRSSPHERLPGIQLTSTKDERFPFAVEFGEEELARFSRASAAHEAGLYLATTMEEVGAAVLDPDGGTLLGGGEETKTRLGDRVRAWLRR